MALADADVEVDGKFFLIENKEELSDIQTKAATVVAKWHRLGPCGLPRTANRGISIPVEKSLQFDAIQALSAISQHDM